MTDPRFETIREARGKALNALNAGIPGSLDAFLHWENVADAALDSLAADLEAAERARDEAHELLADHIAAALARLSAGKETGDE